MLFYCREGNAKLGDVGMSKRIVNSTRASVTGAFGTLAWCAPEMLWGHKCTTKADIYSFGIVLWEIVSGEQPVRGQLRDVRCDPGGACSAAALAQFGGMPVLLRSNGSLF